MSQPELSIHCINPDCPKPQNAWGRDRCAECQSPLTYRHLRAEGELAARMPPDSWVGDRYWVAGDGIWIDTRPHELPWTPPDLPPASLPYLHLHRWRRHLPAVYGFCPLGDGVATADAMLLENIPLTAEGKPYPAAADAWAGASSLRRAHWLSQMLHLFPALAREGKAASLLSLQNVRVQGGRVWLWALLDSVGEAGGEAGEGEIADDAAQLARWCDLWCALLAGWIAQLDEAEEDRAFAAQLQAALEPGRAGQADLAATRAAVDDCLLVQQARYSLGTTFASASDRGRQRSRNEDACYPPPSDAAVPQPGGAGVALVCDGIGGHEGGEVASQLAARSLELQSRALILDVAGQGDYADPQSALDRLEAIVRVANNLIATQNDAQEREARQRMATTLALALQVPQRLNPPRAPVPVTFSELYLVWVGDSRIYWLTEAGCELLSTDDDLAGQEVQAGRSPYREALGHPNGSALTQALGTKDSDFLQPALQRFVPDGDGILLLGSDGFCDFEWVERSWRTFALPALARQTTLAATAQAWTEAVARLHGHDNATAVLVECRLVPQYPAVPDPWETPAVQPAAIATWESDMSEASRALLYAEGDRAEPAVRERRRRFSFGDAARTLLSVPQLAVVVAIAMLVLGGLVGLAFLGRSPSPVLPPPDPEAPSVPAPEP